MDIIQLSYIAGFFDGEGSINLLTRIRPKNTEYSLTVAIGQRDGMTLDLIKENFGGNIYFVKRDGSYYWVITHKKAVKFLKEILPYLQYKKPQALVAIQFYENMAKRTRITSNEEITRRENARLELIALKKSFVKSKYAGSTTKRKDLDLKRM